MRGMAREKGVEVEVDNGYMYPSMFVEIRPCSDSVVYATAGDVDKLPVIT